MGASMQQLDSSLIWPKHVGLPKPENNGKKNKSSTPSSLIEYPQSFQKTLQQINQQFSQTLRNVKSNAGQMVLEVGRLGWV